MNTKTTLALRITLALGSLAALALLLPVLAMVLLALLTLVVPMLLVLTPVLVPLSLVVLADRLRGKREPSGVTTNPPVSLDTRALHAPAR